jgi:hypothetical protein
MNRKGKRVTTLILAILLVFVFSIVPSAAADPTIEIENATYSNGNVSVSGTVEEGILAVAILIYSGDTLLRLETTGITSSKSFAASISMRLDAGTYTVKAADYDGGAFTEKSLTVAATAGGGSSGGSGGQPYSVRLPFSALPDSTGGTLTANTEIASLTLPGDMLKAVGMAGTAEISVYEGDKSSLPQEVRELIGDRPLLGLSLYIDGKPAPWNNPNSPVTVKIPYTPTAEESLNAESLVVWYIDHSGKIFAIPNGAYDKETGTLTFSITHFSYFAVGYNKVSFSDVRENDWFKRAVDFIAARDITSGTGEDKFSPGMNITRGQFITMLLKAYGIEEEKNSTENFKDEGNTYYTGYLAAAKRLGISDGVGANMFAPNRQISRQEMFTMIYNALEVMGQLPNDDRGKSLSDFKDGDKVSPWAKEAAECLIKSGIVSGSSGYLNPAGKTTRGEMAQTLYKLMGR